MKYLFVLFIIYNLTSCKTNKKIEAVTFPKELTPMIDTSLYTVTLDTSLLRSKCFIEQRLKKTPFLSKELFSKEGLEYYGMILCLTEDVNSINDEEKKLIYVVSYFAYSKWVNNIGRNYELVDRLSRIKEKKAFDMLLNFINVNTYTLGGSDYIGYHDRYIIMQNLCLFLDSEQTKYISIWFDKYWVSVTEFAKTNKREANEVEKYMLMGIAIKEVIDEFKQGYKFKFKKEIKIN